MGIWIDKLERLIAEKRRQLGVQPVPRSRLPPGSRHFPEVSLTFPRTSGGSPSTSATAWQVVDRGQPPSPATPRPPLVRTQVSTALREPTLHTSCQ